ncbi:hypothetical protein BH24ACT5_BH24ACT5_18350 [soil metagenome]
MTAVTTMKLSTPVRDELKALAERDGVTMESALKRLLRAERQRALGADLARREVTDEDRAWVIASGRTVLADLLDIGD